MIGYCGVGIIEDILKFLAERRKEDGRITHVLVGMCWGSR